MSSPYVTRLIDRHVADVLTGLPAVLLVGPRACGKTTSAARHARTFVHLDRHAESAAFHADPDVALAQMPEPVLLDEWQAVPGVLGAVKRAVDTARGSNRYLITGSVRADLEADGWPLTGRAVRIAMYGLTEREIVGDPAATPILDRIATDGIEAFSVPAEKPDLAGYIDRALRGGFPESVLASRPVLGRHWRDSYVDQILTRDAQLADGGRDPARLRRYLEILCLNTAGQVADTTLSTGAGIDTKTAAAYDRLLRNLMITDELPAWWSNRIKRLLKKSKRYVVDPGIAASVLRLDLLGVLRDGDILGRLLDTYVLAQLRPEIPVCESRPRLHHVRVEQGRHEIDLLAEYGGGRVFAFEIKATAGPRPDDARHLIWLRDLLGDRYIGGAVLHTGPDIYQLADRIVAAPICSLWSTR